MSDLDAIHERWAGQQALLYGETQQPYGRVRLAYLLQDGKRLLTIEYPTEEERALLQRCAAAPADVQAPPAALETAEANAAYAVSALATVDAERLAERERAERAEADAAALRAACLHARRALDLAHDEDRLREHLAGVLNAEHPGVALLTELGAARAVIEAARAGETVPTPAPSHPPLLSGERAMSEHESAYDKHWRRLAELLGPEEAAAERARLTADERADRRRAKIAKFTQALPEYRQRLARAEQDGRHEYAAHLRKQIAYRERVIAAKEST